jgi:hypothetical protein
MGKYAALIERMRRERQEGLRQIERIATGKLEVLYKPERGHVVDVTAEQIYSWRETVYALSKAIETLQLLDA